MKAEEYQRYIQRMCEVRPEDDSAILLAKRGEDIKVSTFGEVRHLDALKEWAFKWLGGRL